jgi:hypothetical protein
LPDTASNSDLVPSDFFLFGYVREKQTEHVCTTRDELLSAIIKIFGEIGKETLMAVFMSWTKHVRWVV